MQIISVSGGVLVRLVTVHFSIRSVSRVKTKLRQPLEKVTVVYITVVFMNGVSKCQCKRRIIY